MADLYNDQFWTDREGVTHLISDMKTSYLTNVIDYLDRNAFKIKYLELDKLIASAPADPSDGVLNFFDRALAEMDRDPDEWLHDTPLYQALVRERDGRLGYKIKQRVPLFLRRGPRLS